MSTIAAQSAPSLTLRETIAAMPLLTSWRNSKGRLMPLHIRSAPGVGKTMLPEAGVRVMARNHPGRWVGLGVNNAGIKTPADAAGFILFDDIDGQKTSVYTRPDIFGVQRAIVWHAGPPVLNPDVTHPAVIVEGEGWFEERTTDDAGQPLYWGSTVGGQPLDMGIVLMDENDQADVEVRKVLAPLYDEGRVTSHHLPVDVAVWAASNRARDASGTGRGLAFLTNRWCAFEVEPDIEALDSYFRGESIADSVEPISPTLPPEIDHRGRVVRNPKDVDFRAHPAISAYMRQSQETLYAGVPSDPNEPFLTPRSLEALSNLFDVTLRLSVADETGAMDPTLSFADSFIARRGADSRIEGVTGDPVMRWRVFQTLAAGTVGAGNASQFLATLELFDEVPTIADIVKDPAKARVSEKTDAQFITAYLVSNAMRRDNGSALMKYASRLQVALYHNVVNNAVGRDGELLMVPEVAKFLAENPEAMVRMTVMKYQASRSKK